MLELAPVVAVDAVAAPEPAVDVLVLVDDTDSQKMTKMELKDKLSAIIDNIAQDIDKNILPQTIILSEAAGTTLAESAVTLGSALNQFSEGADEAGRFINVLAAGAKFGASEITDTSEALKMATINGATALGLAQDIGSLEINKKADLAIIDIKSSNLWPPHNPYSLIAYAASDCNVVTTVVNGQILMKNRQFLTVDVQEVLNEAREAIIQLIDKSKLSQFSEKLTYLK